MCKQINYLKLLFKKKQLSIKHGKMITSIINYVRHKYSI